MPRARSVREVVPLGLLAAVRTTQGQLKVPLRGVTRITFPGRARFLVTTTPADHAWWRDRKPLPPGGAARADAESCHRDGAHRDHSCSAGAENPSTAGPS